VEDISVTEAQNGNTCGFSCGVCYLISGPAGSGPFILTLTLTLPLTLTPSRDPYLLLPLPSAVYIVNEIADYAAVGQAGQGIVLIRAFLFPSSLSF